jgi:preprotein translocase subunit SecF
MIRFFANARYDFLGQRKWAYLATALFIVPGLLLLAVRGLTYSIEFTGGALLQIETQQPTTSAALRTALETGGVTDAEIQTFGSERDYVVRARMPEATDDTDVDAVGRAVAAALDQGLGAGTYEIVRTEAVGPKVGRELQGRALIAILFSFVTTLMYLAGRFVWRFGRAAVLATAHDILATVAFIRYLDLEVSLVVVAAVLTVVGYSLNDTIVIFDRVRENLRKFRRQNLYDILNLSVNETLPRTILTGGTTIATGLVLAFFAGAVIRPFALVMTFGILVGTFSSIYVASPVLMYIERRWPGQDVRGARLLRTSPETGRPAGATPSPTPAGPETRKATV